MEEVKHLHYKAGFDLYFYLSSPDLNTFKCVVAAGSRTPMPHYHEAFDETVICVKGITTVHLKGKTHELRPGESILIRRGDVHQIANLTHDTIEFFSEIRPGTFGYPYFRDIEPVLNADGIPDIDRLQTIMKSYGLVPVLGTKQKLVFTILRIIRNFKKKPADMLQPVPGN